MCCIIDLVYTKVIPDFGVACRRLTPGPGYLEALCEDNVSSQMNFHSIASNLTRFRLTLSQHLSNVSQKPVLKQSMGKRRISTS